MMNDARIPTLLDLPIELVLRILCLLDPPTLSACELVHSSLRKLIIDSVLVGYHRDTQIADVEDNPHSKLSVLERRIQLSRQEAGWSNLSFDFSASVSVNHSTSGIYDLTGGVYLLGDRARRALHYFKLPSKPSDRPDWRRIDVDATIIDMGLAIYEHNLIAIVTTIPLNDRHSRHHITIVLLEFSTGRPHPQARLSHIFVAESRWPRPAIGIEIVGDNLALVTTHYQNPHRPEDDFYIFNWKTGALKLHASADNTSYSGLLFLSPEILLLPNTNTNTFEFWEVPTSTSPSPSSSGPIAALGLPRIKAGYIVSGIACRCEPNPTPTGMPYIESLFQSSPANAIAIFNVRLHVLDVPGPGATFTMFSHRRSLLNLCPAPQHSVGDKDAPLHVTPWEEWGPPVTRWFNADVMSSRWITTTAGQRCAIMVGNAGSLVVLDFNPARIRKLRLEPAIGERLHSWIESNPTTIVNPAFEDRVTSELPYASYMLADPQRFDGLLMDEERLIGIWTDQLDRIVEIDISHLGPKEGDVSQDPSILDGYEPDPLEMLLIH